MTERYGGGVIYGFLVSPDNSQVIYIADQDTDEVYEVYVANLNLGGTSRSPLYLPLVLR